MARSLVIELKLLSVKKPFQITDENGDVLYECVSEFAWLFPSWRLMKNGESVARIRRKLAWSPTWLVSTIYGDSQLRRKVFAVRPRFWIEGGVYEGAELIGSLFAMSFRLTFRGATIAEARRHVLTIRNRHEVELIEDTPENELLTAVLMASVFIQGFEESETEARFINNPH